jgi:ATP-dependent DNA ligase
MQTTYSSPILQSSTRTGKGKFWQGHIVTDGERWFTQSSYWQTKADGTPSAVQWSEAYLVRGKNTGRANATTDEEQARLELARDVQRQRDRGYVEAGQEVQILPLPMLAHKYSARAKRVVWPAYVQPKLNGQRMLFDGERAWSRGGKYILAEVVQHIVDELRGHIAPGIILDGELILPGNQLLQRTMSAVKRFDPETSPTLMYWVYDVVDAERTFSARFEVARGIVPSAAEHVVLTPTHLAADEAEMVSHHRVFTTAGYEGTMVRSDSGGYDIGHRNNQLLKVKDFTDGEFKIVDIIDGEGRFRGAAIFVCRTESGETFTCVPEGDMSYRRGLYSRREEILSSEEKYLTVRYQELSGDGVPLFPVGTGLRTTKSGGY